MGEASYGKGLVQSVFPLSEKTGLALTTALYYTPSGRSIQKPLDATQFELAGATAHPNAQRIPHRQRPHGHRRRRHPAGCGGHPAPMNRLRMVLEASGSFTNFATEYLRAHKVTLDFEVTPEIIDQFRVFLDARGSARRSGMVRGAQFRHKRLKEEIFTQAFGVEKGDEVEAKRDPVILKAVEALGRSAAPRTMVTVRDTEVDWPA